MKKRTGKSKQSRRSPPKKNKKRIQSSKLKKIRRSEKKIIMKRKEAPEKYFHRRLGTFKGANVFLPPEILVIIFSYIMSPKNHFKMLLLSKQVNNFVRTSQILPWFVIGNQTNNIPQRRCENVNLLVIDHSYQGNIQKLSEVDFPTIFPNLKRMMNLNYRIRNISDIKEKPNEVDNSDRTEFIFLSKLIEQKSLQNSLRTLSFEVERMSSSSKEQITVFSKHILLALSKFRKLRSIELVGLDFRDPNIHKYFYTLQGKDKSLKDVTVTRCELFSGFLSSMWYIKNLKIRSAIDLSPSLTPETRRHSVRWKTLIIQTKHFKKAKENVINFCPQEDSKNIFLVNPLPACYGVTSIHLIDVTIKNDKLLKNLDQLEELKLINITIVEFNCRILNTLTSLLKTATGKIKKLEVSNSYFPGKLLRLLPHLEVLCLTDNQEVSDNNLILLKDSVRTLKLRRCFQIRGSCFSSLKRLRVLKLRECNNLSNRFFNCLRNVEELSLVFSFFKDKIGKDWRNFSSIKSLQIHNVGISERSVLLMPKLMEFRVKGCKYISKTFLNDVFFKK